MLYYWVPDRRCSIGGVEKLQPGTWGSSGRTALPDLRPTGTPEQAAARAAAGPPIDLREVIEASVEAHLVADVPVASFLSGGLDSSIITVLAQRANPDLDAYTITFRPEDHKLEAMPDDALYARKVAGNTAYACTRSRSRPTSWRHCPAWSRMLDEPIGDPAAINTLLMCEAARARGRKVILSGMGADELFGGYRKHLACVMAGATAGSPGGPRRDHRGGRPSRSRSAAVVSDTPAGPSAS